MFIDLSSREYSNYKLQLAKPNKEVISIINEPMEVNMTSVKLNSVAELSFEIPLKIETRNKQNIDELILIDNPNIDEIKELMLINIVWGEEKQKNKWFIIDEIVETEGSEEETITINCYSLLKELSRKKISFENETLTSKDFFSKILEETGWELNYLDSEIETISRTFEFQEQTIFESLMQGLETYGAIVQENENLRTIDIIKIENIRQFNGLVIKKENYLSLLEKNRSTDNIVTRLFVKGADGVEIDRVNPTGQRYLEDFSYFLFPFKRDENKNIISHSHYMSDELSHAIMDNRELSEKINPEISALQLLLDDSFKDLSKENLALVELKNEEIRIQGLWDVAKATDNKELEEQRAQEHDEIVLKIKEKEDFINDINDSIKTWNEQIVILQDKISINSFSDKLLRELYPFIFEKEFSDDRYINDKDLYDASVREFERYSSPDINFVATLDSLLGSIETQHLSNKINLGELVRVKGNTVKEEYYESMIYGFDINFDEGDVVLHIADSLDDMNNLDRLSSLIYQSNSSSTLLQNNKYKWDIATTIQSDFDKYINEELKSVNQRITAGVNESMTLDNRGLLARNPDFPDEMLIMQSGILALSKDGGRTWSTSITPDGVIAERLIGNILAGKNLLITNENGTFTLDSDGLTVDMDSIKILSGSGTDPKNMIDEWNRLILTFAEISDDGLLNTYEKKQLKKQWEEMKNIHNSMSMSMEKALAKLPEGTEKEYPQEYKDYLLAYEKLNKYLNETKQSDGYAILDENNFDKTTTIDDVALFNELFTNYTKTKSDLEPIIPMSFTQSQILILEEGIALNYVRNGEIVTALNLSEEGVRIDGKLLEINAETHFNADLIMDAGKITSKDGKSIVIDLNEGLIELEKPIKIDGSKVVTEDDIGKIEIGGRNYLLNSRDISKSMTFQSNSTANYPIKTELMSENNITFMRIKRDKVDNGSNVFSIYNNIPFENLSVDSNTMKKIRISFKARSNQNIQFVMQGKEHGSNFIFPYINGNKIDISTDWKTFTFKIDQFSRSGLGKGLFIVPTNPSSYSAITDLSLFYLDIAEYKIEIGDISTDWSPAPEDNESILPILYRGYSWSKDGKDRFTTEYPNDNMFLNKFLTSKGKTSDEWTTPPYASNNKIGFGTYAVYINEILKDYVGKPLTFSFEAKVTNNISSWQMYSSNSKPKYDYGHQTFSNKKIDEFEKYSFTSTIVENKANTGSTIIDIYGRYDGNFVTIKNFKIEDSNNNTIYTTAPDDDMENAYPKYTGELLSFSKEQSQNPEDYSWSKVPINEKFEFTGYANSSDGSKDFTTKYPSGNLTYSDGHDVLYKHLASSGISMKKLLDDKTVTAEFEGTKQYNYLWYFSNVKKMITDKGITPNVGDIYTISFDMKTNRNLSMTDLWFKNTINNGTILYSNFIKETLDKTNTSVQRIWIVFRIDSVGDNYNIHFESNAGESITPMWQVKYTNFSLQEGDMKNIAYQKDVPFYKFIGKYSSVNKVQSEDYNDYEWIKMGGESSILHTAYANSSDGSKDFTTEYPNENLILDSRMIHKLENSTTNKSHTKSLLGNYTLDDIKGKFVTLSIDIKVKNAQPRTDTNQSRLGIETKINRPVAGQYYYMGVWKSFALGENFEGRIHNKFYVPNDSVSLNGFGSSYIQMNGDYLEITNYKMEISDVPTIYTPSPIDDYSGSIMKYIGMYSDNKELDSNNYKDYKWSRFSGGDGKDADALSNLFFESNKANTSVAGQYAFHISNSAKENKNRYFNSLEREIEYTWTVCASGSPFGRTSAIIQNQSVWDWSQRLNWEKDERKSIKKITFKIPSSLNLTIGLDFSIFDMESKGGSNFYWSTLTRGTQQSTEWFPSYEELMFENNMEKIEIGGVNLLKDTKNSQVIIGENKDNQTSYQYVLYDSPSGLPNKLSDLSFLPYKNYTLSYDWEVIGDNVSGQFNPQFNNTPYSLGASLTGNRTTIVSNTNKKGRIENTIIANKDTWSISIANSIGFRCDKLVGKLIISNLKFEGGMKSTAWSPNPNDITSGGANYYRVKKTPIAHPVPLLAFTRCPIEAPTGFYMVGRSKKDSVLRISDVITSNGWWTVSFDVRGTQSINVEFDVDICDEGTTRISTNNKNTYERRSVSVFVTNYEKNSKTYNFVDFENIAYAYFYLDKIKVEKGSTSTEWTPNSDDVIDNAIDGVDIGAVNLLRNSNFVRTRPDGVTNKNPNVGAEKWNMYNSGITNATTNYSAYVNESDWDYNVAEFNETDGTRHWKACNQILRTDITRYIRSQYTDFVLSLDIYTTLTDIKPNDKLWGGFYYKNKAGVLGFHDGQYSINPKKTKEWHRISVPLKINPNNIYTDSDVNKMDMTFYMYGYGFSSNGIIQVKDLKLESGNKSTGWSPAPEDLSDDIQNGLDSKADQSDLEDVAYIASNANSLAENAVIQEAWENWLATEWKTQQDAIEKNTVENAKALADIQNRTASIEYTLGQNAVKWNFINTSIQMADEGIMISKEGSRMKIIVSNDRIVFYDGESDVATIDSEQFKIRRGLFLDSITVGNHSIFKHSSVSPITIIKYVGNQSVKP